MNKKNMRQFVILLLLGTIITAGLAGGHAKAFAQQQDDAVVINRKIPLDAIIKTSCTDKEIRLAGDIQSQFRVKHDANSTNIEADFSLDGITGTGATSDNKYQATGTSHFDADGSSKPQFTYIISFVLNRTGTHESVMAHAKLGISIKAKDELTIVVRELDIDCNS